MIDGSAWVSAHAFFQDDLDLLLEAASNKLVIPYDFIDRERDILLRLERNDFLDFFLLDGGQIVLEQDGGTEARLDRASVTKARLEAEVPWSKRSQDR